jgi:hypothetical protein
MGEILRTVAFLHHTTQVITKEKGGFSAWHYDGPSPKKKTVCDGARDPTLVADYSHPNIKQECTQRGEFCRSILVTGDTENQAMSSLLIESSTKVVGDVGHEKKAITMKWTAPRKAGDTMAMGMFASGMQKASVLQQPAPAAERLSAIHLRHCTEKTVAKETPIIVDAATKTGPMCNLIELAQQKAAAAMADTISPPPSYIPGVPALGTWYLGWLLLAEGTHSG